MVTNMGFEPMTYTRVKGVRVKPLHQLAKKMERMMGIEPTLTAWRAEVLPLNYIRMVEVPRLELG